MAAAVADRSAPFLRFTPQIASNTQGKKDDEAKMAWHGMAWHRSWLLCHCGYSFSFGRFWWLSLELLTVDCDVRRARSSKTVGARIVCHLKKPNMYSLFNFRFPGVICGPGLMLDYNDRCRIIRGAERGIHPRRIRKNFCCTRGSDPCWYKYVQQRQFGH